jgi:hypothetical protein
MSQKYLSVANNEYINPAHIVRLKLIQDALPPNIEITEIEFHLIGGAIVKMSVANLATAKAKLKLSDIEF